MRRDVSEKLRWVLVVGLTTLGGWFVCAPPAPEAKDPMLGHRADQCPACQLRAPNTRAEADEIVQHAMKVRDARLKADAGK